MYADESKVCKQAVDFYGEDNQRLQLFEEMGELMQAISKQKRYGKDADEIAEEIADVEIMIEQIKHIYKCHKRSEYFKVAKLTRLRHRIEGGNR